MTTAFTVMVLNELKLIFRARATLFWIFLFPFFFLAMMLFSYGTDGALASVIVELADEDHSERSAQYEEKIRQALLHEEALRAEVRKVDDPGRSVPEGAVRIIIPAGFGSSLQHEEAVAVRVVPGSAGVGSEVVTRWIRALTVRFNAEIARAQMLVTVDVQSPTARSLSFAQYMLTGTLVMSMLAAAMSSTCVAIADRRERHTFKLMSCLPVRLTDYLAAMLVSRLIVLALAAVALVFGAVQLFGIPLVLEAPRLARAALVIALGAAMLLSLGLSMASRMASVPDAVFATNLAYIVLLFLSDLTMPLSAMPADIKAIVAYLPTSAFVTALRGVLVAGDTLELQKAAMAVIVAWTFGFLVVAWRRFRWHRG
ncbi:ABC transporter permease [Pseudorhodoferax sp. Leaf274]|uniref:ABC transporter permease n=1 Tax=Pseudorhodoferax sp. Leaf274 TaxID=1736318 RepID=UPI00070316D7|nr:ABC transporter permease [Pseudorhodoferax sp. Leaf274]KQP41145.1 hypothetical protein ASF44_30340 [Pseudorhodoferax sp. Leaf274]